MVFLKTKGIVIKEVKTGEADKVVTLFTSNTGKLSAYARGARRPKNRLVAGMQFLCYSELVLYPGKNLYSVNSSEVIESFYGLRNDIEKLTYSAYLTEIINDVIQVNEPAPEILKLFLNTLYLLEKSVYSKELIIRTFEMRLMVLMGYSPHVKNCVSCGNDEPGNMFFSFKEFGFLCSKCKNNIDSKAIKMSENTAEIIQCMIFQKHKAVFKYAVTEDVLFELERIFTRYLVDRLEKRYTKLDFLKALKFK